MDSSFGSLGASDFEVLQDLFEKTGHSLDERVREMVDSGREDCFCGKPDCPVGMAIRKEIERRGGKPSIDQAVVKAAVKGALGELGPEFELKVAKAVAVGVSAALKRERGKSLFGLIDHVLGTVFFTLASLVIWMLTGVLLAVLTPLLFIRSAIQWKKGRSYLQVLEELRELVRENPEMKEVQEALSKLPGGPNFITRSGWRFGAWVAKRPEGFRNTFEGWRMKLVARFRRSKS